MLYALLRLGEIVLGLVALLIGFVAFWFGLASSLPDVIAAVAIIRTIIILSCTPVLRNLILITSVIWLRVGLTIALVIGLLWKLGNCGFQALVEVRFVIRTVHNRILHHHILVGGIVL